ASLAPAKSFAAISSQKAEVPLPRISESLRPSKYASLWKIQKATNIVQILCRCFSIELRLESSLSLRHDPHPLPHPLQHLQRLLQLIFRVRCGHDCSDAGFAFSDGGACHTRSHYAFFQQCTIKLHGQLAIAEDDRRHQRFPGRRG